MAGGVNAGAPLEAEIVGLAHDGRGIARLGGKAVFIDGALPGERVRFCVFKRRRHMDEARLLEVLVPSADRVQPKCEHFGVCGGCALQHLAPAAQLAAKQSQLLEDLQRIGRVRPQRILEPLAGPAFGYRRRARLGVKLVHKKGRVLAGFRERRGAYLADIRRCEVLIEELNSLPQDLAVLAQTLSIREHLPQVEVAAGDEAAALVFRVLAPLGEEDRAKLEAFGARRGVQIYVQSGGIDTIRPLHPTQAALSYSLDLPPSPLQIAFGPNDFIQVNRDLNRLLVAAAMEQLEAGAGDTVLDLFCGLGNFTLPLARRAARVVGVEGDAGLVAKAEGNSLRNGIANTRFIAAELLEAHPLGSWASEVYDRVLLDPPRAGARALMERMSHWGPRRVVYISCHPASLARDAGILVQSQGFDLIAAGVMDMFPHTTHVESMAVFEARA